MPKGIFNIFPTVTPLLFIGIIYNLLAHVFAIAVLVNGADITQSTLRVVILTVEGVGAGYFIFLMVIWRLSLLKTAFASGRPPKHSELEREISAGWTGALLYTSLGVVLGVLHFRYTGVTNAFNPSVYPTQYVVLMSNALAAYIGSALWLVSTLFVPIVSEGVEKRLQ